MMTKTTQSTMRIHSIFDMSSYLAFGISYQIYNNLRFLNYPTILYANLHEIINWKDKPYARDHFLQKLSYNNFIKDEA